MLMYSKRRKTVILWTHAFICEMCGNTKTHVLKIQDSILFYIPGTEWECIMGIMHSFSQRGAVVVNLGFGVKHY